MVKSSKIITRLNLIQRLKQSPSLALLNPMTVTALISLFIAVCLFANLTSERMSPRMAIRVFEKVCEQGPVDLSVSHPSFDVDQEYEVEWGKPLLEQIQGLQVCYFTLHAKTVASKRFRNFGGVHSTCRYSGFYLYFNIYFL